MSRAIYLKIILTAIALSVFCGKAQALAKDQHAVRSEYPSIAIARPNAAAILPDGTLWAWGHGGNGVLGNGRTGNASRPVYVDEKVLSAALCDQTGGFVRDPIQCSLFYVKEDHSLWACGYNGSGILLDGAKKNRLKPVRVMEDVTDVYSMHIAVGVVYVRRTDGSLWGWGCGDLRRYIGQNVKLELDLGFITKPILLERGPISRGDIIKLASDDALWHSAAPRNFLNLENGTLFCVKKDAAVWSRGMEYFGLTGNGRSGEGSQTEFERVEFKK